MNEGEISKISEHIPHYFELQRLLFGLAFLFNGISTIVGYLMPKLFPLENSSGTM